MAYNVTINDIDRTSDVIDKSIVIEDIINDKQNLCRFNLIDRSGNGIPETDQEITITLADDTKIFGGTILSVKLQKLGTGTIQAAIECTDFGRLLDSNLVRKTYLDSTDKTIIEDIVSTYAGDFDITTNNVVEGVTLDQITFNYIQPSQAIRQIADLTGRNWYIDYDKDIHYFPLTTNAAPFNIDSSENRYTNLQISKDASQLKNRVFVRGGTKKSDFTTYETTGDGEKKQFVLPDKPSSVTLEVDRGAGFVEETVGIKNVNLTGFDWYLNFQEKYVEQDINGTILSSTDTLKLTYKYDIPILVALEDSASIIESGVKEFAIFDKSITTINAARDRASAELTDYANSIVEGTFRTYESGFISGQYININLTDYDINADYIVQRVTVRALGSGLFSYDIEIASAKTMGIIRFLIELLEANKNLIELDDDEVLDEINIVTDSLLSDSLIDSLVTDSAGPYKVWAPDSISEDVAFAQWNLFQWAP